MEFDENIINISSDSDCESQVSNGSLTPEYIITESGHLIMPEENAHAYCYNYLYDVMQATFQEAITLQNYNPAQYTFYDFCKTVKYIGLGKKDDLHFLNNQRRHIHNYVLHIMLYTIAYETQSCDNYMAKRKLFLFCYKAHEIMSGM